MFCIEDGLNIVFLTKSKRGKEEKRERIKSGADVAFIIINPHPYLCCNMDYSALSGLSYKEKGEIETY
jgi:hypothetical protein